jgi:hypothetical protein
MTHVFALVHKGPRKRLNEDGLSHRRPVPDGLNCGELCYYSQLRKGAWLPRSFTLSTTPLNCLYNDQPACLANTSSWLQRLVKSFCATRKVVQ